MDIDDERRHILEKHYQDDGQGDTRIIVLYKRRWWVTFVFCFSSIAQSMVWNTWGPISESSEVVFGWTDGTIGQIINMSAIAFAIFVLPFGIFMDSKGLRIAFIVCSVVMLACTLVRCFTMDPNIFTPLAYVSSALQGVGGLVTFSGTVLFAAVWFPVKERASITAVVFSFNCIGTSLSFILAPLLVPGPIYVSPSNISQLPGAANTTINLYNNSGITNVESMKTGIQHLMFIHAAISGLAFLLAILYFPAKPPTPPSITASIPRENYRTAIRTMLTNGHLWIVVVVGALPRSFAGCWISVFDIVVKPIGVSQTDAGMIGFWQTLIGCSSGIVFAKFSDFLSSRRKGLVLVLTTAAVVFNIWTALLCDQIISFNIESLYVSTILQGLFVHGLMPLFYEMSAEAAYPVGEGMAGGFLTLLVCACNITYFGLVSLPGIGVSWMTWSCVASLIISLPLMFIFKERNKRYDIDIDIHVSKQN